MKYNKLQRKGIVTIPLLFYIFMAVAFWAFLLPIMNPFIQQLAGGLSGPARAAAYSIPFWVIFSIMMFVFVSINSGTE